MNNMKLKISDLFNKPNIAGILFILPAIVGTFIFIVIPTIASFALSFADWDLLNEIKYVGLQNYYEIFTDKVFVKILIKTGVNNKNNNPIEKKIFLVYFKFLSLI